MAAKKSKKNPYAPPPGDVVPLGAEHISRLVDLHVRSLQFSLAAELGHEFLTAYYNGLLASEAFNGRVFRDAEGRTAGFCVFTADPGRMNRQARAAQRRDLALKTLGRLQEDPKLFPRLASLPRHFRKLDALRIQPEVTLVAWHGPDGIGDALLLEALRHFKMENISEVRAIVPVNDGPHCNLLERHNFQVGATFRSLGNELNIFKIDAEGIDAALAAQDQE